MPLSSSEILVVGTRGYLLAFNKYTGAPLWKYQFERSFWTSGSGFVTTLVDGDKLFAGCYGEIYCFDLLRGRLLWKDNLSGKGYGVVSFAVLGAASSPLPGADVDKDQFNEERPG